MPQFILSYCFYDNEHLGEPTPVLTALVIFYFQRNSRGFQFAKLYYDVGDYESGKRYQILSSFSTLDKQRICVNTQLKSSKEQLKLNVCVPKSN